MAQPLIVLTGAAGRFGGTVHRTLLDSKKTVRATDRIRTISPDQPLIKANLLNAGACREILREAGILVHLAYRREPLWHARGYPSRTFDDHIRLNRHVFEAACEAGVKKIIYASSIQVIARQLPWVNATQLPRYLPLDENTPAEPDNWYSLAKVCTEEMLAMLRQQYGIDYVVLRFPSLVNEVPITDLEKHRGRVSEGFSYLSYRDAANLVLKLVEIDLPGGRTYFPASHRNTMGRPVPELIRDYYTGVPLKKPAPELKCLVDISKVTQETGWEPQELSQPEVVPHTPFIWRSYRRMGKVIPQRLKPTIEQILLALE